MRVVIAEDEALLRTGLVHILDNAGHMIVGEAADAQELLRLVDEHRPDLVITDIRMPPAHTDEGLRAALHIRAAYPGVAVVVLSQYVQRRHAVDLITDHPSGVGYLLKQRITDIATFCADLNRVGAGDTVLDPEVVDVLMARARRGNNVLRGFTARQREVLALMAQGLSNAAIARRLSITERAVVQHTSHIYDAMQLPTSDNDHRRVLAVIHFLSQ